MRNKITHQLRPGNVIWNEKKKKNDEKHFQFKTKEIFKKLNFLDSLSSKSWRLNLRNNPLNFYLFCIAPIYDWGLRNFWQNSVSNR